MELSEKYTAGAVKSPCFCTAFFLVMARHYYPAIFEPAKDIDGFVVTVPDIQGCLTQGKDLTKAMYWTVDAIGTMLDGVEEKDYPKPSKVEELDLSEYPDAFVNVIEFDPDKWKKTFNPIRKAREQAGMTIKELSNLLGAPYRTVQDWNSGERKPPTWLVKLIVEKIESSI